MQIPTLNIPLCDAKVCYERESSVGIKRLKGAVNGGRERGGAGERNSAKGSIFRVC